MRKVLVLLLIIVFVTAGYYAHDMIFYRDTVKFLCPLENCTLRYDGFGDGHFGAKRGKGRLHKGIDMMADVGAPVFAMKSGWAISKLDQNGYGNWIKVFHKGGYESRYGHLEAVSMRWIRKVKQGDIIGWAGKSGNARNKNMKAHLHFEIRKDGEAVDPLKGYIEDQLKR